MSAGDWIAVIYGIIALFIWMPAARIFWRGTWHDQDIGDAILSAIAGLGVAALWCIVLPIAIVVWKLLLEKENVKTHK